MVRVWELEKVRDWTTEEIKKHIWAAADCGQPIPGNRTYHKAHIIKEEVRKWQL